MEIQAKDMIVKVLETHPHYILIDVSIIEENAVDHEAGKVQFNLW